MMLTLGFNGFAELGPEHTLHPPFQLEISLMKSY